MLPNCRFSFTQEFVYGPENSIPTSHVLAVIHDCSSNITRNKLDFRIKRILQKFPDKKSILILNKVLTILVVVMKLFFEHINLF